MAATTDAAGTGTVDLRPERLEVYRRELTGYCYRMLGSAFEAEDAVQDTLVRAWQAADRFEGRSSARSWLYRIATNVCLDMLRGRSRRARPMELGPSMPPEESSLARMLPEHGWVSPIADSRVLSEDSDPAEIVVARESIRLAFVTALQHLPPRQRAALILCEVLRWQTSETADLLGTSVAAINSALQRARATLAAVPEESRPDRADDDHGELLAQYVDAFERYDVDMLVTLLHEDAIQSMPPFAMRLAGARDIGAWMLGPGRECRGSRLLPVAACGTAAFGQYRVDPAGGHAPWALQVLEISGDRISGFHTFLDAAASFPAFGLPAHLPE
ncbi:MAG TPA: sigma-70 family RNA polymerase sigma factor [Streptosporangiaceae bacterium]|nr:sigma-70 family RNA polymerase sigma factor [Streptosporangiaceae bacterium]